jgi:uncharacterized protein (TIGR02145 family)
MPCLNAINMNIRASFFIIGALLMTILCNAQTKGTLKDPRDNQVYKTIKIGEQVWMAENLNYAAEYSWCYDKDTSNCSKYGRLYNFEMAQDACPTGWHLPSDLEWTALTDFLGGEDVAGLKMKGVEGDATTIPTNSKMNSSGFSGLAGGNRNSKNLFSLMGKYGCWWSSTEYNKTNGWARYLTYATGQFYSHFDGKNCGFSIRCLKN